MKRIIVVLLLCAMIMPMLAGTLPVGASDSDLTVDGIKKGLSDAYAYLTAYAGMSSFDIFGRRLKVEVDPGDTNNIFSGSADSPDIVYERSKKLVGSALDSDSYDISTRSDLLNVLKNHYTESAANAFIDFLKDSLIYIRIRNDGELYIIKDPKNSPFYTEYPYSISRIDWVENVDVNGSNATAYVWISAYNKSKKIGEYMRVPIEYELVNGEWLIAENVFFTKIFTQDADKYVVEFEKYKTPMTPSLDGETLSLSDVRWLVETAEALLMGLSNNFVHYHKEDPYGVVMNVNSDWESIRPYEKTDMPEYIKNAGFGKVNQLYFSRPVMFDISIESRADFDGFLRELFTPSAAADFTNSLTDRMHVLYFSDNDVYMNTDRRYEADMSELIKVNDIKSIEYNGNTAKAVLELLVKPRYEFDTKKVTVPFEFEKAEGGWRISKNPYGSELHSDYMDALPDNYRDAFPEICPLPELTGELTREYAELLCEKVYRTYTVLNYGKIANIRTTGAVNPYYEDYSIIQKKLSSVLLIYDREFYDAFPGYYRVDPDREFDFLGRKLRSLNDVNKMLAEIVTDDIGSYLKSSYLYGSSIFVEDRSGRLFMYMPESSSYDYCYLNSFGAFKQSGNSASLEVFMIKQGNTNSDPENKDYIEGLWDERVTVNFIKTKDGWRISGGTMFELLYGDSYNENKPSPSPSTGDSILMLVLISAISLAGVCVTVKKRKIR